MANGKKKGIDRGTIRIFIELSILLVILLVLWIWTGSIWCGGCGGCGGGEVDPIGTGQQGQPVQPQPDDTEPDETTGPAELTSEQIKEKFWQENGLRAEDYPDWALEVYETATENRSFLLNYPIKYGQPVQIDISDVDRSQGVPLFIQWDDRWGYLDYGSSVCGISGCAPTCLSMVAYYLTGNAEYTPAYMLEFATQKGHMVPDVGTDWSLFATGAKDLGFDVEVLPLVKGVVTSRLEKGIPVVITGRREVDEEGNPVNQESLFTASGHFVVLVGYKDGYFQVNDPNSPENSQKQWAWADFQGEIRNLWAISNPAS